MTLLFAASELCVRRGERAVLSGISFALRAGERVALVGTSGAGKSTLIAELHRALEDEAALCPQDLGLVDALSVYHNVYMGRLEERSFLANLWNLFFPLPAPRREVTALLAEFGLAGRWREPVGRLSGGERQRVALCRACFRRRPVFLGDEPVSNLDPEQGRRLLRQVLERHSTAVVALHDPALALDCFDRIVGLAGGRLAFDRPATALDRRFLADFYLDRGGVS
ncbi:MAG: phosphonates import ATP-binding protein PhnC [Porticoccaceae bacterium]|nr:MAG: phosphonates import ATP-binding protein PhnC [Porticoccaceae bacterium]